MLDLLTRLYPNELSSKSVILNKLKIYSGVRFLIRVCANLFIPFYFKLFQKSSIPILDTHPELIVSLTSFPLRINKVSLVIETLLRQTHKPDKIILWLSKSEFVSETELPSKLIKLKKRGLEIRFKDENLLSHKKFFYTLQEFPDSDFIIVDDDVLYPSWALKELYLAHIKHPDTVCFNRGYEVKMKEGEFLPYRQWEKIKGESGPSDKLFATGRGGVYYPKGVLNKEVLNKGVFLNICEKADDIWLYLMTISNQKQLFKTRDNSYYIPIIYKRDSSLSEINMNKGYNDIQLKSVKEYLNSNNSLVM